MRVLKLFLRFLHRVISFFIREIRRFVWCSSFKEFGKKSYLRSPMQIDGAENISIGNRVYVGYKAWLAALPLTGTDKCTLVISNDCAIGNFNHI